jgi:hypothetical protein
LQRLDGSLVQGCQEAAERATMGQSASSEQGHEGSRKRLQAVGERFQGGFPASCIAHEHREKVDQVVAAKARTAKANVFREGRKQILLLEVLRDERDLSEPYWD